MGDPTEAAGETRMVEGYAVGRVLGRGGFGTVYQATRLVDGRAVAVKVALVDQALAVERLTLEGEALKAIGPPHVPALYAVGTLPDGAPYLIMEYVPWPTLDQRLKQNAGPMPIASFGPLSLALLDTLEAVHAHGFVHRDLKPANIFVDDRSGTKLIDFGIVRRLRTDDAVGLTTTGAIVGTAEYMAPEQCESGRAIDARTDLYALGVILYQMVSGRLPFVGPPAEVQQGHLTRRPARLAPAVAVPVAVEEAILRCLAKAPDKRFANVAELRSALEQALAVAPAPGVPQPVPEAKSVPVETARARERRQVGLLFFESGKDPGAVQSAVSAAGGQLVHRALNRFVAVFGEGDNPVRRALLAGRRLQSSAVCDQVVVDLTTATIRAARDGSRRYMSAVFAEGDRFPSPQDPPGVLLSAAAVEVFPELASKSALPNGRVLAPSLDQTRTIATQISSGSGEIIGRNDVIRTLAADVQSCAAGREPRVVSVVSAAGMGKSHLCASLLERFAHATNNFEIIALRAPEPIDGDADQVLVELLRRSLAAPAAAPADGGKALLHERLGPSLGPQLWAGAALALGWLGHDAPELAQMRAAPGVLRSAAARAAGEGLRRRAASRPVIVLIDDAHFADDASLDALEYATLAEAAVPVWVGVFARPTFERARPSFGGKAHGHSSIALGPLDPASAGELCRKLLKPAESVPAQAIEGLVARTQGIPLLLSELCRGLKRDGVVRKRPKGQSWFLATDELERLPDLPLVEWLGRKEIDALPPDLVAHARLGALLGAELTVDEMEGVLARLESMGAGTDFPLDAAAGIRDLRARDILVISPRDTIHFRNSLLRETVLEAVPAPLAKVIHQAAYEYYQAATGMSDERRLAQVATHAFHAGLTDPARDAYLALSERASARHAYIESEQLYTRALEAIAVDDAPHRLTAFGGRGSMRHRLGRYDDALKDFGEARAIAAKLGDTQTEAGILLDEATALDFLEEWRRALELVERAQALVRERAIASALLHARISMGLARYHFRFTNDRTVPVALFDEAVKYAEPLGADGYETFVVSLMMGSSLRAGLGRLAEANRNFNRLIAIVEERADMVHLYAVLSNQLAYCVYASDHTLAEAIIARTTAVVRDIGNPSFQQVLETNASEFLHYLDDTEGALRHADAAIDIGTRLYGDALRPEALLNKARILAMAGRLEPVRAAVQEMQAGQERARNGGHKEVLFFPYERVLFGMLDLATRPSTDAEWDALIEESKAASIWLQPVEVRELRGLTALRRGDTAAARQWLTAALTHDPALPTIMKRRIESALARSQSPLPAKRGEG